MMDSTDFARTFKQPRPLARAALTDACGRCWTVLVDGICFWHDHGCSNGCGPISHRDGFCDTCGSVTFSCPGDGCQSSVHHGESA